LKRNTEKEKRQAKPSVDLRPDTPFDLPTESIGTNTPVRAAEEKGKGGDHLWRGKCSNSARKGIQGRVVTREPSEGLEGSRTYTRIVDNRGSKKDKCWKRKRVIIILLRTYPAIVATEFQERQRTDQTKKRRLGCAAAPQGETTPRNSILKGRSRLYRAGTKNDVWGGEEKEPGRASQKRVDLTAEVPLKITWRDLEERSWGQSHEIEAAARQRSTIHSKARAEGYTQEAGRPGNAGSRRSKRSAGVLEKEGELIIIKEDQDDSIHPLFSPPRTIQKIRVCRRETKKMTSTTKERAHPREQRVRKKRISNIRKTNNRGWSARTQILLKT